MDTRTDEQIMNALANPIDFCVCCGQEIAEDSTCGCGHGCEGCQQH
jgi:hypothetical protein